MALDLSTFQWFMRSLFSSPKTGFTRFCLFYTFRRFLGLFCLSFVKRLKTSRIASQLAFQAAERNPPQGGPHPHGAYPPTPWALPLSSPFRRLRGMGGPMAHLGGCPAGVWRVYPGCTGGGIYTTWAHPALPRGRAPWPSLPLGSTSLRARQDGGPGPMAQAHLATFQRLHAQAISASGNDLYASLPLHRGFSGVCSLCYPIFIRFCSFRARARARARIPSVTLLPP